MANVTRAGIDTQVKAGSSGNMCFAVGKITGNGAGGQIAIGDVVRLVKLPAFCRVVDVRINTEVDTASLTIKAGYADVDGDANFTDDDAFVVAATGLATAATFQRANNPLYPWVDLKKESYITITTAGAAILATTDLNLVVYYEYLGNP